MSLEDLIESHDRITNNNIGKIRELLKERPFDVEKLLDISRRAAETSARIDAQTKEQRIANFKYKTDLEKRAESARKGEVEDDQIDVSTIKAAEAFRVSEEAEIKDYQLNLVIIEAAKVYFYQLVCGYDILRAKWLLESIPALAKMVVGARSESADGLIKQYTTLHDAGVKHPAEDDVAQVHVVEVTGGE